MTCSPRCAYFRHLSNKDSHTYGILIQMRNVCQTEMNINLEEIGNKSLLRFSYKQASNQSHPKASAVLPRQGAIATKTSLENKHLGNGDYFVIIASSLYPL